MEVYTKTYLFFDPRSHDESSVVTRHEPSSSSPPEFHINFQFSCKFIESYWIFLQRSGLLQFLKRSSSPMIHERISLTLAQFLNEDIAREIIGKEVKSWPFWEEGRQIMIDFALDKAQEVVKSMSPSHNAVYINVGVIPVKVYAFNSETIRSAILEWMEGGGNRMIPATGLSIESLESRELTMDDCETCSVCLEDFCRGCEAICMPCSHVFHGDCIKKWLCISHYCPICRFEMPTE